MARLVSSRGLVLGWSHCGWTLSQSPHALISLRRIRPPLLTESEVESGWRQRQTSQQREPLSLSRQRRELLTSCQSLGCKGRHLQRSKQRALRCRRAWSVASCGHRAPRECHQLWRKRTRSRRLSVKNHDLMSSASSASEVMKLWSWKRTPQGGEEAMVHPFHSYEAN